MKFSMPSDDSPETMAQVKAKYLDWVLEKADKEDDLRRVRIWRAKVIQSTLIWTAIVSLVVGSIFLWIVCQKGQL